MKKILVLGATGFLGMNLVEYLTRDPVAYELYTPGHRELCLLYTSDAADE